MHQRGPNPPDKPVDARSAARQLNIIQAYVQDRKLRGRPLTEKERAELTKLGGPALLDVFLACYEAPYWLSKALTEPAKTPADILDKAKLALDVTTPPPVANALRSALVETYYSGREGDTRRALQASAYECLFEAATEMSSQDLTLPPPPQRAEDPSKGLRALERWALEAMRGQQASQPEQDFTVDEAMVCFRGTPLSLGSGIPLAALKKLLAKKGSVVPFKELEPGSLEYEASETLRKAITTIRRALKAVGAPYELRNVKNCGYYLARASARD